MFFTENTWADCHLQVHDSFAKGTPFAMGGCLSFHLAHEGFYIRKCVFCFLSLKRGRYGGFPSRKTGFSQFIAPTLNGHTSTYLKLKIPLCTFETENHTNCNRCYLQWKKNLSQLSWILFGWILLRWLPDWKTYEDGATLFIRVDNPL